MKDLVRLSLVAHPAANDAVAVCWNPSHHRLRHRVVNLSPGDRVDNAHLGLAYHPSATRTRRGSDWFSALLSGWRGMAIGGSEHRPTAVGKASDQNDRRPDDHDERSRGVTGNAPRFRRKPTPTPVDPVTADAGRRGTANPASRKPRRVYNIADVW